MIPLPRFRVQCIALALLVSLLPVRAAVDAGSSEYTPENASDSTMPGQEISGSRITLDKNSSIGVTAELRIRHDDNVYLTNSNEVSDTIIAAIPGVDFRFGQSSLAHGFLSYRNAFTRYLDKSSSNVSLGDGAAEFGYDGASLSLLGNATFQQLNQNNSTVAALGQQAIFRRDLLAITTSAEARVSAKTSIRTGINHSNSDYKTAGLTGSQETEVPLKFYFEATPKVSLSTGVAYRWVKPQNGGAKGRDFDFNIGARGNFTAKLSGELSLDYRTRSVGNNSRENLWGLNGTLNYEVTPKTTSVLVVSTDFGTGALGESLKSSQYSFRLSSNPTPQWQLGAGLTFRRIEYGPAVFGVNNAPAQTGRSDNYWEGDVQTTYFLHSRLAATVNYTYRLNNSNLTVADFSNSILSLSLGWRF